VESPSSDQARWFADEVQPHEAHLRKWLGARFPAVADHDDLVQESFLRLLRARTAGPIENTRAFLFTIARNVALSQIRHRRRLYPDGVAEIESGVVPDDRADTAEAVARRQEVGLLHEALAALPERCREVLVLRRIHGMSQKDIAARLGIAEKTVENHSLLALEKCAEFFRRRGATGTPAILAARRRLVETKKANHV
jgi:RNA polymerase sigma-70 factor (ECF subfamily)